MGLSLDKLSHKRTCRWKNLSSEKLSHKQSCRRKNSRRKNFVEPVGKILLNQFLHKKLSVYGASTLSRGRERQRARAVCPEIHHGNFPAIFCYPWFNFTFLRFIKTLSWSILRFLTNQIRDISFKCSVHATAI